MEFQIKQNYGDGCGGWIYFTAKGTETIDELKKIAVKEMLKDWAGVDPRLYFGAPKPAMPTIEVAEYKNGSKVRNGIKFKTKWR